MSLHLAWLAWFPCILLQDCTYLSINQCNTALVRPHVKVIQLQKNPLLALRKQLKLHSDEDKIVL